jgi:hypothetical protein
MSVELLARVVRKEDKVALVPMSTVETGMINDYVKSDVVKIKVTNPRNYEFHKKAFALIQVVFSNMIDEKKVALGIYSAEALRKRLTIETGYCEMSFTTDDVRTGSGVIPAGTVILEPMSWSFEKMSSEEFEKLYDALITISIAKYCDGQDEESINRMVNEIIRFA